MKKLISILALAACSYSSAFAQPYQPWAENLSERKKFQDKKYGMLIHWGASSVLGASE